MEVYLVTYDNGEEYEMNEQKQIGIFDSYDKAKGITLSKGFEETEDIYFFVRKTLTSASWVHFKDYIFIENFEMNVLKEDTE